MPSSTLTMSPTVPSSPFIPVKLTPTTPLSQPLQAKSPCAPSPSPPSPPAQPRQNTAAATLRPLYARAVRAFLHRDIVLTHSLLSSAFALISPPLTLAPDSLTEYRRKWDVLRITLEVTVYTAPPADTAIIPASLRSNALLSAAALLASLHTRSLRLFAPADGPAPNPAFLPPQVLVTLALSSAKIGCPAAGRGITEEWLACRIPNTAVMADDGYDKVLEVYLLSILPALGEWAYAKQFIEYETELPVQSRERLATSLASLHEQHLASRIREPPAPAPASPSAPTTPKPTTASRPAINRSSSSSSHTDSSSAMTTPTPSRPSSPTPSSSSASSNSTHTAVPANPHPRASRLKQQPAHGRSNIPALTPLTPTSSGAPFTAPGTYDDPPFLHATSRTLHRDDTASAARSPARRSSTPSTAESRPGSWHVLTRASTSPSLIESMHAALRPYVRYAPLFLLCIVLPALAMFLRALRRRSKAISGSSAAAAAAAASVASVVAGAGAGAGMSDAARARAMQEVRRRLSSARRGMLGTLWDETVRAIWDTVAMGGRALV